MRQVPTKKYSLIGSGRLAKHLNFYFKERGLSLSHWSRRHDTRQKLPQLLSASDVVLLAISDNAIEPFLSENSAFLKDKICVHFSGAITSEKAVGIHPLNTFAHKLYPIGTYETTPLIVDCDKAFFEKTFPNLTNPVYHIDKHKKPIYHALISMMGNFTTLLWQEGLLELEKKTSLPKEVISVYQHQIFKNLKMSPDNSLTGPFSRGDMETVEEHKKVLVTTPLSALYQCFQDLYFEKTAITKNNSTNTDQPQIDV